MIVLKEKISIEKLNTMAQNFFSEMIKGVVDVDKELLSLDAELHSDLEGMLLESGSKQNSLWGINIYPHNVGEDFVEFDSMINIRPSQNNRSRGIEDENIRKKVMGIVAKWIEIK